jgi:amino acid permease
VRGRAPSPASATRRRPPHASPSPPPPSPCAAHDIGWLGSLCLVCNNIIGPGMFALPALFQQTGWVPALLLCLAVAIWTNQASLYMARTLSSFASNGTFSKRMEYSTMIKYLLPKWAYLAAMLTLCASFFSQNLANIILTSQVMDETLLGLFGGTCAITLYPSVAPVCVLASATSSHTDSPFGDAYAVSIGYVLVLGICIPLGYLNLDDNIGMQIGGMALTLVCVGVWVANFMAHGVDGANMPAVLPGLSWTDYGPLLSSVLFNYGFVATIPSWLNEKHPSVGVTSIISYANLGATAMFIVVAMSSALAFENLPGGCGLLAVIDGCHRADAPRFEFWRASRVMTYVFPIANILTSIPVFSIIIRYNLLQLRVPRWCCCGRGAEDPRHPGETTVPVAVANAVAVVAPWVAALPFYVGNQINTLMNWSSAIMFVLINMVLPLACYLAQRAREDAGLPKIEVEEADVCEAHGGEGGGAAQALLSEHSSDDLLGRYGAPLASFELAGNYGELKQSLNRAAEVQRSSDGGSDGDGNGDGASAERISPLPACLCKTERAKRAGERGYARALLALAVLLTVVAFALQVYVTTQPPPSDDDQTDDDANGGNSTGLVGPRLAGVLARLGGWGGARVRGE